VTLSQLQLNINLTTDSAANWRVVARTWEKPGESFFSLCDPNFWKTVMRVVNDTFTDKITQGKVKGSLKHYKTLVRKEILTFFGVWIQTQVWKVG